MKTLLFTFLLTGSSLWADIIVASVGTAANPNEHAINSRGVIPDIAIPAPLGFPAALPGSSWVLAEVSSAEYFVNIFIPYQPRGGIFRAQSDSVTIGLSVQFACIICGHLGPVVNHVIPNGVLQEGWNSFEVDAFNPHTIPTTNFVIDLRGASIPEPGSVGLMVIGLAGICLIRLRNRRSPAR